MTNQLTFYTASAGGWERALYAFLAGKERRSGSRRTVGGLQPNAGPPESD